MRENRRSSYARWTAGLRRGRGLLAILLATTGAVHAEDARVYREIVDPSDPNLRMEEGRLLLTLDEAVAIALERNLSLRVERYVLSESRFTIQQAFGIYDLNARADVATTEETSPATTNLAGADVTVQESQSWNFGVDQLFSSGGTLSADWANTRSETNSTFATLNPSFRVDLDVNFLQPLLRDRGSRATNRGITVARTNFEISEENFRARVIETLQQVQDGYWILVEAQEQLKVAEESLALAKQLHEQNRVRVEVGTLAPLELVQSEAGVANREEDIIRAQAAVGDAEDVLRQLLRIEKFWDTEIVPETEPEMERVELVLDEAIERALGARPEIVSKRLAIDNQRLDSEYFRNQRQPRLDLSLRYGLNGLGGDITQRDFITGDVLFEDEGDYGDALDQITEGDFDGWRLALNFAYPVQNRAARAQSAIADVALERGLAELEDLELQVLTEVRRLYRAVETAAKVIDSARASRTLEEKNLDAEQKRYQNGMSTSFQVLEIQEDLTQARSREVSAVTGYRRALTALYRSEGQLLERSGVELAGE